MAVQGEEDLVVVGDQLVPQLPAVGRQLVVLDDERTGRQVLLAPSLEYASRLAARQQTTGYGRPCAPA